MSLEELEKTETGLYLPPKGCKDWHEPLNENFKKISKTISGISDGTMIEQINSSLNTKVNIFGTVISDISEVLTKDSPYITTPLTTGMHHNGYWSLYYTATNVKYNGWIHAIDSISREVYYNYYQNGVLGKWKQLTTAEKPELYDLPLVSGFTIHRASYFYKDQFGEVRIHLACIKDTDILNEDLVAVIPFGFLPESSLEFQVTYASNSGSVSGTALIEADGTIRLYHSIPNMRFAFSDLVYIAK